MNKCLLVLFLLFSTSAFSQVCENLFAHSNQPSLDIFAVSEAEAAQGYWLKLVKKKDASWYSTFGPFRNAPQGDPTWIFKVLGPKISRELGFKMVTPDTILIPTIARINDGISVINYRLVLKDKLPLPYRFYSQKYLYGDYVMNAADKKIPININDPLLAIHDIIVHVLALTEHPILSDRRFIFLMIAEKFDRYYKFLSQNFSSPPALTDLVDLLLAANGVFYGISRGDPAYRINYETVTLQQLQPVLLKANLSLFLKIDGFSDFAKSYQQWLSTKLDLLRTLHGNDLTPEVVIELTMLRRREINSVLP
jgi:hypothetical protein